MEEVYRELVSDPAIRSTFFASSPFLSYSLKMSVPGSVVTLPGTPERSTASLSRDTSTVPAEHANFDTDASRSRVTDDSSFHVLEPAPTHVDFFELDREDRQ